MTNPYESLGLQKNASADDIKTAYRNLAKKYHPDLNPGNKIAEAKFKEINSANELLGDPAMKAKFDRGEIDGSGQPASSSHAGSGSGRGPFYHETQRNGGRYSTRGGGMGGSMDSSFFDSLFGNAQRQYSSPVGEDISYHMEIELADAVTGKQQEIVLPQGKRFQVKIPPGIDTGAKLRFRGQGGQSPGQSTPGDLYIEIKVKPSALFKRVGKDIELDVPVSIQEAILGGEIKVPTLSGSVMLKVPSGVNTGTKLRIKGRGVPGKTTQESGDQIVTLRVMLPEKIDPELESIVRNWSQSHTYDPRAHLGFT